MKWTMAQEWQSFRRDAISPKAPPLQVTEMRRAFYAGAYAFMACLDGNLSDSNEITPEDEAVMPTLAAELEAFVQQVKTGHA